MAASVVVAIIVAAAAIVAIWIACRLSVRAINKAQRSLRAAEGEVAEAIAELRRMTEGAEAAFSRLDAAAAKAEASVATAELAVRLADLAVTAPVAKARAWSAGGAAAARTFRERRALRAGTD